MTKGYFISLLTIITFICCKQEANSYNRNNSDVIEVFITENEEVINVDFEDALSMYNYYKTHKFPTEQFDTSYRNQTTVKKLEPYFSKIQNPIIKRDFLKHYCEVMFIEKFSDKLKSKNIHLPYTALNDAYDNLLQSFHGGQYNPSPTLNKHGSVNFNLDYSFDDLNVFFNELDNLFQTKIKKDSLNRTTLINLIYDYPYFDIDADGIDENYLILIGNLGTGTSSSSVLVKVKDYIKEDMEVQYDEIYQSVKNQLSLKVDSGVWGGVVSYGGVKPYKDGYLMHIPFLGSSDGMCCPSILTRFFTRDFITYDKHTLEYKHIDYESEPQIWTSLN